MNKTKATLRTGLVFLTAFYSPIHLANDKPSSLFGTQLALYMTVFLSADKCAEPKACQARHNYCCDEVDEESE